MLLECALNGLLTLDPESPPQACRWRQTFRQAMIAADHDTTRVGTPHCDGPSLAWANWQVPADGPGAGNKQLLDDHLIARLTPKDLPPIRRAALVDLTTELLTTEILRAFVSGLHLANLPSLAHRHHARLQAAAECLANECTLRDGLIYVAAAIAKAGEAADANPAAPQARMSVYALNSFCAGARERWQLPKDRARSDHLERDQLSAMTWTLFKGVLGFNPLSISRSLVETLVTTDLPNPQSQEHDLWLNSILDREHLTDPEAVLDTLTLQHQNADPMIAATAEMLTSLVDRLFQVTGDLRSALAAAVAVNEKLDGRIIVPGTASSVRVGDYLSELMWRATGIGPPADMI